MTTQEMLDEVELMIEEEKRLTGSRQGRRVDALRAIAGDIRGRLDGAPSVALVALEQRMVALARRRSGADRIGAQIGAAEELVARWATVKHALERFGASGESNQ